MSSKDQLIHLIKEVITMENLFFREIFHFDLLQYTWLHQTVDSHVTRGGECYGIADFSCRLCLSISDFHPDTWNPAWSVSSILTGLLSFMLENTCTMGSVVTSTCTKKQLAKTSGDFNLKSEIFCELFPGIVKVRVNTSFCGITVSIYVY